MAASLESGNGLPEPYSHTVEAIYRVYETKAKRNQSERSYLGLSAMSSDCDRAIWYAFRWATPPEGFDGRKLRLFETGHREETRLIRDLRAAGMTVQDHDPETGAQWGFEAVGGHVRGHLDGKIVGVPEAPSTVHVLECKTHNAKSFKALLKDGVKKSKPGHWRQMLGYMHLSGLTRAFYIAQCKDDDAIHVERVEYDADEAARLFTRIEWIISAVEPPHKLYEDPKAKMAFVCGYCPSRAQCHDGAFARINCRTCLHSSPIDGGWRCERHGIALDLETQKVGCPNHLFIPGLVPGEQVDADEAAETVTYTFADGSTWVDGGATCSA